MRQEAGRRDWLLTGLSVVAVVMMALAVGKAVDFRADAAPVPTVLTE